MRIVARHEPRFARRVRACALRRRRPERRHGARGLSSFFFFNDTATTEIYTLSLYDALPICPARSRAWCPRPRGAPGWRPKSRSEEHTSELQSRGHLVCRLLLEKKKNKE